MVLESLVNPKNAIHHPLRTFLMGGLFASFAVLFSLWIFRPQASLVMVFLTVVISIPLMYSTLREQEALDLTGLSELTLLQKHSVALSFLTLLFMGYVVAFSLWYLVLPSDLVSALFMSQLDTISAINSHVTFTGNIAVSGSVDTFFAILLNNIKVFVFCLFFAFFFGAGALFILVWNASVISAAVGTYFRRGLEYYALSFGWSSLASYFHLYSMSIMRFMLHGVFEIVSYFIGGLAGGILSLVVMQKGLKDGMFKKVFVDALSLMFIAVSLLVVGAFVEVYITPLLF